MEQYVPKLQERLRREGYPRFAVSQTNQVLLGPQFGFQSVKKWVFSDASNTTAVVVAPDFISLETSNYKTFDEFTQSFLVVLKEFGAIVEPALCERLGLRYVNLIRPRKKEALSGYLKSSLLGLTDKSLGLHDVHASAVVRGKTGDGDFVLRLVRGHDELLLPADLTPPDVEVRTQESTGPRAILDIDHFWQGSLQYDPEDLLKEFWALHDPIENAFTESVTPKALDAWGRE
jgi:uncharacterized protein (TIGR04255 family)